jgi:hypothetical protein
VTLPGETPGPRVNGWRSPWMGLSLYLLALICTLGLTACSEQPSSPALETWTPPAADAELHPVSLVRPTSTGGMATMTAEITGTPAAIGCATCHSEGSGPALATRPGVEKGFHKPIQVNHGGLICLSCHVPDDPGLLHLVDGKQVTLLQSIQLCSQCHGPQRRNFDHGAHGGMRGYWDLQRGPRYRNDCVTCHSPHAPTYPTVTPMPGPRDRFAHPRTHPGSLVEQRYGEKDQHE